MTREKLISTFVENMERERTALNLTQAQMAERLNISTSGYKKMIAGETAKIDLYLAFRMHEISGNLFLDFCKDESEQLQILNDLYHLNSSNLRFVKGIIDFELAFQNDPDRNNQEDYIDLLTPTGNQEDGMIWDSVNIEKIDAGSYKKRFGPALHCAIQINSIHLHPVYNMGDILLVSMAPPRDGDTGLFINKENGLAYFRRFRQTNPCLLETLNGYGVTFTVDPKDKEEMDKWVFFGKILSKVRQ